METKRTAEEYLTWLIGMTNEEIKGRSLEEAAAEIEREMTVRNKVGDRWVEEGRITKMDRKDRWERMEAALWFLGQLMAFQKWHQQGAVTSTGDMTEKV